MKTKWITVVAIGALVSGCTISQKVEPVTVAGANSVCIVQNPAVRASFLTEYTKALHQRGYSTKILPASSPITQCTITSTYTANWRWDMAMYMAYAQLIVYHNGAKAGEATYDALNGGANMGKFIHADQKIAELVNKLFPQAGQGG